MSGILTDDEPAELMPSELLRTHTPVDRDRMSATDT